MGLMSSGYMETVLIYTLRMVSWLPYNDDSDKDFIELETINTEEEAVAFYLCVFG